MSIKIINGWLREGSIRCPSCQEICTRDYFRHQKPHLFDTKKVDKNVFNSELPFLERNKRISLAKDVEIAHNLPNDLTINEQHLKNFNNFTWQCVPDDPELWKKLLGDEEIGDTHLEEPCSAQIFYSFFIPVFFTLFLIYFGQIFDIM